MIYNTFQVKVVSEPAVPWSSLHGMNRTRLSLCDQGTQDAHPSIDELSMFPVHLFKVHNRRNHFEAKPFKKPPCQLIDNSHITSRVFPLPSLFHQSEYHQMSQKFEYTFFPPNTLTTNETLAVVSKVGHAISQETQSTIRYDRQLNKIEIMSKSEQSLNQAKKRLKEALWKVPEPPTVASARSRAQWSKKDKQEIWANADEHVSCWISICWIRVFIV